VDFLKAFLTPAILLLIARNPDILDALIAKFGAISNDSDYGESVFRALFSVLVHLSDGDLKVVITAFQPLLRILSREVMVLIRREVHAKLVLSCLLCVTTLLNYDFASLDGGTMPCLRLVLEVSVIVIELGFEWPESMAM